MKNFIKKFLRDSCYFVHDVSKYCILDPQWETKRISYGCITYSTEIHWHEKGSDTEIIKFLSNVGLILTVSKITVIQACTKSLDNSVGIGTGYGLESCGSILGRGKRSSTHTVYTASGVHPPSYTMGIGGKEAGAWSWQIISIPPYVFMARCLIKRRNNLFLGI
jgi:hypothetical protein